MENRIAGGGRFLLPACVCGETGGEGKYFMCGNGLVGRAGKFGAGGRRFEFHLYTGLNKTTNCSVVYCGAHLQKTTKPSRM